MFVLLAGVFLLAGCGEKSVTSVADQTPTPQTCTVIVDCEPDSLKAAWHLMGPDGFTLAGRADTTLADMATGEYFISWEPITGWSPPLSQTMTVSRGGVLRFQGIYIEGNPFQGLEFGTDATLEILTWNIEHFPKSGQVTVDLVARAVMAMEIDILALQEIQSSSDFRELDDKLAGWTGVLAASAAYDINLAFLYRTSGDWIVDSVGEIYTGLRREFPRPPFVLEGRFKGTPVVIINNHFKCCGDNTIDEDPWDEEARRRDAGILLDEYVRDHYAGRKVIIVGDLNDSLTDHPANNVFNVFLDAPVDWRFVDMEIARGPSAGWSFPGWPSHLDHILVASPLFAAVDGPAAEVSVIPVFEVFPGGWAEYDNRVSDHLPVALKVIP
jgi:endonuclease/exonuclease/phosphatase family metal-dependent hydrolase